MVVDEKKLATDKFTIMKMATTILISIFSLCSRADILFEGYAKVTNTLEGIHCGYIVNRYEFDQKKKQFISFDCLS